MSQNFNNNSSDDDSDLGGFNMAASPRPNMFSAVQQQYQADINDMLDDISMPNQSMSMSNLSQISQSPFRGGNTQGIFFGTNQSATKFSNQSLTISQSNNGGLSSRTGTQGVYANQTLGVNSSDEDEPYSKYVHKKKKDADELDIRELSIDQKKPSLTKNGGRDSPDFNNLSSSDIRVAADQSQMITSRSNLPAFKMNFGDVTPNRAQPEEKQQNRTFADSVLLQGIIDQQKQKREEFESKADMSGISTLTANVQAFRMNMPKTPDRGAASTSQASRAQKASDEDDTSKSNLDMSGISNLKAPAYMMKFKNEDSLSQSALTSSQMDLKLINQKHQELQNQFLKVIEKPKPQEPDLELEEAIQSSKPDTSPETQKLRVEISMLKAKNSELQSNIDHYKKQLLDQDKLSESQRSQMLELDSKVIELLEQNKMLQQNTTQLPSFLSRAQENARKEIFTLKSQISERDSMVAKLQKQLHFEQSKETVEQSSLIQQIEILCGQIDKQTLLTNSLKKQGNQKENESEKEIKKMKEQFEQEFIGMTHQMQQMDQYIQNIVKEYQEKEQELQQVLEVSQNAQNECQKVQKENQVLLKDIQGFQERCKTLEIELEVKGKSNKKDGNEEMEFEIRKMRDNYQKQIGQLKEDKGKIQNQLSDCQNQLKAFNQGQIEQESKEKDQKIENLQSFIDQIKLSLQSCSLIQQNDDLLQSLQQALIQLEEHEILQNEYEMLQSTYQSQQTQIKQSEQEIASLQKQNQTLQRQANGGPSSFTKNMLIQKDAEILELKATVQKDRQNIIDLEDKIWHSSKENEINQVKIADNAKQINEKNEEIKANLQNQQKVKERYENEIAQLKQTMRENQIKIDGLDQQIDDFNKKEMQQTQSKDEKMSEIQEQIKSYQTENQRLKVKISRLEYRSQLTAKSVSKIEIQPEEKEQEPVKEYKNQGVLCFLPDLSQESEQSSLKACISDLKSEISSHLSRISDLQSKLKSSERLLSDAQSLLDEQIAAQQEYEDAIVSKDLELKGMKNQVEKAKNLCDTKQQQIEIMNLEQEQLQVQFNKMSENEKKIMAKFSDKDEIIKNLQDQVRGQILSDDDNEMRQIIDLKEEEISALKESLQEQKKVFEEKIYQKEIEIEMKEKAVESKFQKQIQNIEGEFKDGKESLISNIYDDHKIQLEDIKQKNTIAVKKLKLQHEEEIENLRFEFDEQISKEDKKYKDLVEKSKKSADKANLEVKKLQDDLDRIKKSQENKSKQIQSELSTDLDRKEIEHQEAIDSLQQKLKKDVKTAQEKVRADMKNQIDAVKNELASSKAVWEREKKKMTQDHENNLNTLRNQLEDEALEEQRQTKEKADKLFKKRLQDKENLWQQKFLEIEEEISELNEAHRLEIKSEKERIESRLKEQIRAQITPEITQQLEGDFQSQIEEFQRKYQQEIEKLQIDLRHEKSQNMPTRQSFKKEKSDQESQTTTNMDFMHQEIQQIKDQYDAKLKNLDLKSQKNEMIKQYEQVLNMEFDKILLCLKMKGQNLSQEDLDKKRGQINKLIQKILYANKELNLKNSMDVIKKKISTVLQLFKESLEEKSSKKIQELEEKLNDQQNQSQNIASKVNKLGQDYQRKSMALMSEQNVSVSKSFKKQDLIPQKQGSDDYQVLHKLEPQMTNSQGQIIVEVEKVLKDLQVYYQSMRASKFFKLCIQTNDDNLPPESHFDAANEDVVKRYRDLLNYLFKMIVKLNNGADQLCRQNEVYRLKLLNQDLREQLSKFKHFSQDQVSEIFQKITSDKSLMNMFSQDSIDVLNKIKELTPNLDQLLEHQNNMIQLFTIKGQINKNAAEINQNCLQYMEQFQDDEHINVQTRQAQNDFTIQDSFYREKTEDYGDEYDYENQSQRPLQLDMMSQNQSQRPLDMISQNQSQRPIQLDMMSQNQAVDLLAQVFQKLNINNTQNFMSQNPNNTQENLNFTQNRNPNVFASQQYPGRKQQPMMFDDYDETEKSDNNHTMMNEDCIKQAESLLNMFKQGGNETYQSINLPLQQKHHQRQRMGSTVAGIQTNVNNSMFSQGQARRGSTGGGLQNTQQQKNLIPKNKRRNELTGGLNNSVSAQFRSIDQISNFSGGFSQQTRQPQIPPLQLKQKHSQTRRLNEDSTSKSMTQLTGGYTEEEPQQMNTADDYYKYHKKRQDENNRRTPSQVVLQKIEKVVSPISIHKQGSEMWMQQPQESMMQLKPPSLHRMNSANTQRQQTQQSVEKVRGPGLPKAKAAYKQTSQHHFQTVEVEESYPYGSHSGSVNLRPGRQAASMSMHDESGEISQQTLTFRKNKQPQYINIDQEQNDEDEYQSYKQKIDKVIQKNRYVEDRRPLSDDLSDDQDMEERNSQKETIQMYASREVSNKGQSLVKIKQRMNNSGRDSSQNSYNSSTRVNNRYN